MAMSVVGATPFPRHHQNQQHQHHQEHSRLNLTANSLEQDEEDYFNDTMFTAIRGVPAGGNNNLFDLRPDKANGRKAAKTTATTKTRTRTASTTTTISQLDAGKGQYFEVPDLINQDIDEEERQELEEAIRGEDADGDGDEEGTVIMPDFDELPPRTAVGTTTTASSGEAGKLNVENWQKGLRVLGFGSWNNVGPSYRNYYRSGKSPPPVGVAGVGFAHFHYSYPQSSGISRSRSRWCYCHWHNQEGGWVVLAGFGCLGG